MTPKQHRPSAQARRDALLRATVEVAAEVGKAGVTHRAVTERAGLPLATVSYFFASIDKLAEEALRLFTAADTDAQLALADALTQQHSTPDDVARAFGIAAAPRRPDTLAMIEAYLYAARNPEFSNAVAEALDATRRVAAAAAAAAGSPDPDASAAAYAALVHGFALHELAVAESVSAETVHRAFRALFLGFLLDAGHTDLALSLANS